MRENSGSAWMRCARVWHRPPESCDELHKRHEPANEAKVFILYPLIFMADAECNAIVNMHGPWSGRANECVCDILIPWPAGGRECVRMNFGGLTNSTRAHVSVCCVVAIPLSAVSV